MQSGQNFYSFELLVSASPVRRLSIHYILAYVHTIAGLEGMNSERLSDLLSMIQCAEIRLAEFAALTFDERRCWMETYRHFSHQVNKMQLASRSPLAEDRPSYPSPWISAKRKLQFDVDQNNNKLRIRPVAKKSTAPCSKPSRTPVKMTLICSETIDDTTTEEETSDTE
jgi:hypothetical protein